MKTIRLTLGLIAAMLFGASMAPTSAKADFFSTNWQPMGLYSYSHGGHTYGLFVLVFGSTASVVSVQNYPPHVWHAALTRCWTNGLLTTYASPWNNTSTTNTSVVGCEGSTPVDAGGWFID